jgi:hypothetical protein
MKKITELNEKKTPVVRIDKSLNKYEEVVLFPNKVRKANKMLREIGLPKSDAEKLVNN